MDEAHECQECRRRRILWAFSTGVVVLAVAASAWVMLGRHGPSR